MSEVRPAVSDWSEMLRARVIRNRAILSVKETGAGSLVVEIPLRKRWFMKPPLSVVFPFRQSHRIELDGLGARIFEFCSGEGTVEELVDAFAEQENLSFHESRLLVTSYLKTLMGNGLVAMELPSVSK